MDPYQTAQGPYDFNKDTSHLLLLTLQQRGHSGILSSIPNTTQPPITRAQNWRTKRRWNEPLM